MDETSIIANILKTKNPGLEYIETTANLFNCLSSFMLGHLELLKVKKEKLKDNFKLLGGKK